MRKVLGALSLVTALVVLGCAPPKPTGGSSAPPAKGGTPAPQAGASPSASPAGAGAITPANTKIAWVGTKKEGKHDGGFEKFTGGVSPAAGDVTASKITLEIDTDSLTSDNPKLTGHLKSPDFFDVKKFPTAKFVSTTVKAEAKGDSTHVITGDLTLHGTTKPITFPAKIAATDDTLAIDSTFTFDRTEYGIAFAPDRVDKIVTVTVSAKVPRK